MYIYIYVYIYIFIYIYICIYVYIYIYIYIGLRGSKTESPTFLRSRNEHTRPPKGGTVVCGWRRCLRGGREMTLVLYKSGILTMVLHKPRVFTILVLYKSGIFTMLLLYKSGMVRMSPAGVLVHGSHEAGLARWFDQC